MRLAWWFAVCGVAAAAPPQHDHLHEHYWYDSVEHLVPATQIAEQERYDPSVADHAGETWMCWLRFTPGEGDRIEIARAGEPPREVETGDAVRLARPSLTPDSRGLLWLTWEGEDANGDWNVWARPRQSNGSFGPAMRISGGTGADINHRVAADPAGGIWITWQTDRGGQFDIAARRVVEQRLGPPQIVSTSPRGDWHPSVAAPAPGFACIAWDTFTGSSFDVVARWSRDDAWGEITAVARGPSFQARARVVPAPDEHCWIAWEEGGPNWGGPYRSLDRVWNNVTDEHGPIHRLRKLRLAAMSPYGVTRPLDLPMPSLAAARRRLGARAGVADLGAFYERASLANDQAGRLWIAYRHYFEPQLGLDEPVEHHIEKGFRIYARCLEGTAWSELYAFDVMQRDGMQRLEIAGHATGITAVWDTGRTDRRTDTEPRGVQHCAIERAPSATAPVLPAVARRAVAPEEPTPRAAPAEPVADGERSWKLFYGDLHRHTDLSLCFPFFDGSIDDAYRYAIEVAELDFLGITDHTRDIARGDALSQLWWRSTKEVRRHALPDAFFPYFAYERSHGDTDHNVISLRDDMLRDFPPPLPEFWQQIDDGQTFTIPHAPFLGKVWQHRDDERRPLLEIYQGFRDHSSQDHAHEGLAGGHHVGFIASSDHLSTSASYAGVWSDEASREAIFDALKARRTYGATAKIRLAVRCGEHWMGERFASDGPPEIQLILDGTAAVTWVDLYVDGEPVERFDGDGRVSLRATLRPALQRGREHHVYVHVMQDDGNQAWSSPLWITQ